MCWAKQARDQSTASSLLKVNHRSHNLFFSFLTSSFSTRMHIFAIESVPSKSYHPFTFEPRPTCSICKMPSTPNIPHSPALASKEQSVSDLTPPSTLDPDIELQTHGNPENDPQPSKVSAFKSLGLLDRFLAVWILLAMAIGIILGNFVPNTGPALQKGKFVGVCVPIGKIQLLVCPQESFADFSYVTSNWIARYDVSDLV